MLVVGIQREMNHLLKGKHAIPNQGLTVIDIFILIMCNSGRSALGKYLRPRQSPTTPWEGGFCTHPSCSCPRTCCSPKISRAESCSSSPPASIFSLGFGPGSSGPGEQTAPIGNVILLEGVRSDQQQECQLERHRVTSKSPSSGRPVLGTLASQQLRRSIRMPL